MYWIQPDASGKIVVEHPRQRHIYDKTAVSYHGRRTESLDTAMVAAWGESQLKTLDVARGKSVQDKVGGSYTSIDAPRALGVASGGIGKIPGEMKVQMLLYLQRLQAIIPCYRHWHPSLELPLKIYHPN